ncbi:MAG: FAD-linked oxidase C-terminal domain-containing protein, partial [Gemmatimonadota bacterium]
LRKRAEKKGKQLSSVAAAKVEELTPKDEKSGKKGIFAVIVAALAGGAFALVLIEVDGSPAQVEDRLDTLRALGRRVFRPGVTASDPTSIERLWSIRRGASPTIARKAGSGLISTQFIEDCVVPPARLHGYLEGLEEILEATNFDAIVFGHAGDGNVHVNPLLDVEAGDCIERVRRVLGEVTDLVSSLDGTLSGEHGDGRLRTPLLSRVWAPHLTRAFEQVKERVDPRSILNPGVICPLPGQDPLEGFSPRQRVHPG